MECIIYKTDQHKVTYHCQEEHYQSWILYFFTILVLYVFQLEKINIETFKLWKMLQCLILFCPVSQSLMPHVCLSANQLAFSASLLASGDGHTGPFYTPINLIFRKVVTNIVNEYNPNTGLFTAPVRGVYHFEFHIYGGGSSTSPTAAVLVKDGEQIFTSWTSHPSDSQKASYGVSLLLEIGDAVFLRMWANSWISGNRS
uniref:C1q domain-containing protein n=1 Tax=Poecilia reticulata TaxID=8081 RepID=A0A3P9PCL3_POERE